MVIGPLALKEDVVYFKSVQSDLIYFNLSGTSSKEIKNEVEPIPKAVNDPL